MILQFLFGSAIITATIIIHVGFTAVVEWVLKREHLWPGPRAGLLRFISLLAAMTLLLLASISICVWLWALSLIWAGVFQETEPAVYFSLVTFTTLGFGDIVLGAEWRIMSGLMAANGLLIFGLTTAVLVDFLARFRRR
jgi:hypothetical protein